jgi:hypothetical protein
LAVQADGVSRPMMDVDYRRYGQGEALLGWLNATLGLEASEPINAEQTLMQLAEAIQRDLAEDGVEIAHLKLTATAEAQGGRAAVLNLVGSGMIPELCQSLPERTRGGELIVNLRAEAPPLRLREAFDAAIAQTDAADPRTRLSVRHIEQLEPSQPRPTWRGGTAFDPVKMGMEDDDRP